ncbi:hypothetical protein FS837_004824 [Tulasnella sp. UAMH 9824]|nr:hypothetical protein FS837_004824 [Tulasnella sp. UAMH 9824]
MDQHDPPAAEQPPSSLTSEPEPATPSQRPQLEIRKSGRRFEIVGLISTVVVFAITSGTATLILGWLYAFHDPVAAGGGIMSAVQNGSFVIRESSGLATEQSTSGQEQTLRILTFSALASHLVSLTSTILVTLLAYRSANQWLLASENPDDVNLTPIQYGLLVRTLGSGSLMSLVNTLRYTCRSKRATAPRLFKEAFISVAGIYILSHIVGVTDLWLHSRTRSMSIFRGVPDQSEALYSLGYNETTCGTLERTGLPCQRLISTRSNRTYWADEEPWIHLAGLDTFSGTNPDIALEYVDNTTILVPGPSRNFKSQGFTINTYGLKVDCTNLRDQCDRLQSPFPVALVPGSSPVTNCSKAGYPHFPYYTSGELEFSGYDSRNIKNMVLGIIGSEMGGMLNGTADFSTGWTSNPATMIVQLRDTPSLWWNHGTPGVLYLNALDFYGKCKMAYLDVIAEYDPIGAEWTIAETILSRPELASIFWTPMIFQLWTSEVRWSLTPYTYTGEDVISLLASSISKYGIASTAPLMKFTPAFNLTTPQPIAVGLYPVVPTLLLVGCLYIYSVTALVIFFLSCTANKRSIFVPRQLTGKKERDKKKSSLDVAQSWLTDPLPPVGSMFPGGDGRHVARSVQSDPLRQVYDSNWGLVKVGIGLYKGSKGEMIFGLMRQTGTRARRYGRVFSMQDDTKLHGTVAPQLSGWNCERTLELEEQSSSAKHPQLEIRMSRRRFRIAGLLPTLCVVAMTGGTGTLILGWLCASLDPVEGRGGFFSALRNGSFVVTEPSASDEFLLSEMQTETLRILLFSALASHLVSVAGTVLVTLLAYRAAAQWLHASETPDAASLTPIQYGLLVRTLGSGGLMSIINSLRYISRSKRGKAPRLFKEALFSVTVVYLLTHGVGLVDLWLHSSARAVSVIRSTPVEVESLYGIAYNEAKCGPFDKTELPCQNLITVSEGKVAFSVAMDSTASVGSVYYTFLDVNPYLKLEYINGAAILVPGPSKHYQSRGFNLNTYGLRVQCDNLRDQCERLVTPFSEILVPGGSPVTNCSKAGYPQIPYHTTGELKPWGFDTRNIETLVLGIIGDEMGGMVNGTANFTSAWTPNPASTVVQIRWPNITADDTADSPVVAYLNALDLYATCSFSYLDIVARYDAIQAEWSILEESLSSPELASVLWTPLMFQWAPDFLLHELTPYVTSRGSQAMEILEKTLARANMAFVTAFTKFIPASNVTTTRQVALGVYSAAPTFLLIASLYIYSLVAIFAFALSSISNNRIIFVPRHLTRDGEGDEERSALEVAQTWLTDPLPFIGLLFPGEDGREAARSAETDPLRQVYDSQRALEKVRIGLYKWINGEMIFGLVRQSHSRTRRYETVFPLVDGDCAPQEEMADHGGEATLSLPHVETGEAAS